MEIPHLYRKIKYLTYFCYVPAFGFGIAFTDNNFSLSEGEIFVLCGRNWNWWFRRIDFSLILW